jgi:hypothetical protein
MYQVYVYVHQSCMMSIGEMYMAAISWKPQKTALIPYGWEECPAANLKIPVFVDGSEEVALRNHLRGRVPKTVDQEANVYVPDTHMHTISSKDPPWAQGVS